MVKARQNSTDSPKAEVGEIDTRAPFESVKAAVSLFGEVAFSGSGGDHVVRKSKPFPTERVYAKETQLHLTQKELNKLKEQLKNAEDTKAQALVELEKAKRAVDDLTNKLRTINESKESAIKATETAKDRAKQIEEANSGEIVDSSGAWKQELETAREQYMTSISELNDAKQELRKIRQDFEASLEAKVTAFHQAEEAEQLTKANAERAHDISKEIAIIEESLLHVKLATEQARQEQAMILAEKDSQRQCSRAALDEAQKRLASFKEEFNPEFIRDLETQLDQKTTEIDSVKKEIENAKASDLDSVRTVTSELDGAKETLHKVAEEESTLRSLVESLKLELENVKKEHSELREKEAETESIAGSLHVKLRKCKAELEAAVAEESKARGASDELMATLQQLASESENSRREAEEMQKNAEELRNEAAVRKLELEEAEKKLQVALQEAEGAKAAETQALVQIKVLSERTNAARASTSESGAQITVSAEEFEALNKKVEQSDELTEMKIAAAMAQVEAIKASENEASKKLEAITKEIEEMKTATEEALKRAEMAEAAKKAVEGELRRWREREQKKAAETAARILADSEVSSDISQQHTTVDKQMQPEKTEVSRKVMDKSHGTKKALLPNLSGIFHRKKNQVEGASPSYLPGEKPV
ncbi:hypothetical protein Sjap_025001 [Stephania japonica]|uniref:WEB family protein n=1 Tax=Stephania japonica TaxID=461633 RepID=A0AAP0E3K7_9MAGN